MKNTLCCLLTFAFVSTGCATDTGDPPGDPAVDQVDPPADPGVTTESLTTTTFTATYRGQGSGSTSCNTTFNISGAEPTDAGTFPVFIYMIGTTETFTNAPATAAVNAAASRGFVAATIQYNSGTFSGCSTLTGKSRCIFDASSATSAVSTLCARPKADCSKGVVAAGFSQGSVLADLSANFDPRVRAAYGMGDGVRYSFFNLSSCVGNGTTRRLPSDRLRAVNGEQDQFIGPNQNNVRSQMLTLTGLSCGSTATSCLNANGSGWIIVLNNQVADGSADHCYMRANGNNCGGSQNTTDAGWATGTQAFQLAANIDFLKSFTDP
jgi:hypothetical protein